MAYYLAGCFRNEMQDNSKAIADVAYDSLADMYSYHVSLVGAMVALILIGIIYRVIWLVVLKIYTVLKRRAVMRRVESARRKARKIITAGLRWRRNDDGMSDHYDADIAMGELEFGAPSLA